MSVRRFPTLPTHAGALPCFNCAAPLAAQPPHDCEYADGEGRYRKICPICCCRTYYDLEPPKGAR